jgi:hypothetical protein
MKVSYGIEFYYKKENEPQKKCKLALPEAASNLPLPKAGDGISFDWDGKNRRVEVMCWRFDYSLTGEGVVTGLHVAILLEPIEEPYLDRPDLPIAAFKDDLDELF